MHDIEKYIRENASAFDSFGLPEGHAARFEARLDAAMRRKRVGEWWRGIFADRRFAVPAVALAAVAFVLAVGVGGRTDAWLRGVGDDPAEIYMAYSENASSLYGEILTKDWDMDNEARSIVEETVPLLSLLPDELDDASKSAILKEYYGTLLDGLSAMNRKTR